MKLVDLQLANSRYLWSVSLHDFTDDQPAWRSMNFLTQTDHQFSLPVSFGCPIVLHLDPEINYDNRIRL